MFNDVKYGNGQVPHSRCEVVSGPLSWRRLLSDWAASRNLVLRQHINVFRAQCDYKEMSTTSSFASPASFEASEALTAELLTVNVQHINQVPSAQLCLEARIAQIESVSFTAARDFGKESTAFLHTEQ